VLNCTTNERLRSQSSWRKWHVRVGSFSTGRDQRQVLRRE
jgi:hypothetical protein